jgi:hypothetical protein
MSILPIISDDGTMARNPASSINELSTMVNRVTLRVFSQPVRANRQTDTFNIRASASDIGTRYKQTIGRGSSSGWCAFAAHWSVSS